MTGPFVVFVQFEVAEGRMDEFLRHMLANARTSLADEPGCRRFDVVQGHSGRILLYEIYDDEAAFGAHCRMPHFLAFDAAVKSLVVSKTVETGALLEE